MALVGLIKIETLEAHDDIRFKLDGLEKLTGNFKYYNSIRQPKRYKCHMNIVGSNKSLHQRYLNEI